MCGSHEPKLGSDTGKPSLAWLLHNLVISLIERFERFGNVASVERAVSALEVAVQVTLDDDPAKPVHLGDLGNLYSIRFIRFGDGADIDRAISSHRDAVRRIPDDHVEEASCLTNLGRAYGIRFQWLGDAADIDNAISNHEGALHLVKDEDPTSSRPLILSHLGTSLLMRFTRLGDNIEGIEQAISILRNAVQVVKDDHKALALTSLGDSYHARFQRVGDVQDIDRAISSHEDAVRCTPDDHPEKVPRLTSLGDSLIQRFEHFGDVPDIDRAISSYEDGVLRCTPDDHPDKVNCLNGLGHSFFRRFERLGDIVDIDRAVSIFGDAVRLAKDYRLSIATYLINLGNACLARFRHVRDVADLDRAISSHEDAVRCTPDDHPDKAGYLTNQGSSFGIRFQYRGDVADIDSAISNHEGAARRTPDHAPDKTRLLKNLGASYGLRFERLGDDSDLDKAILHFEQAARSLAGSPRVRFKASLQWAACALQRGSSPLAAYGCAIDLLPRVAWLGLTVSARHEQLAQIGDVVRAAAAAAIKQEEYALAMEWLEQGRSIVWGQVLSLRSPVDHLRAVEPALADRLETLSKQIENPTTRDTSFEPLNQLSSEDIAQKHRRLTLEWEHLVEKIRALPGFDDFLRPKKLSQLREAARYGPVVVINIHEVRCDALVIMADLDEVVHIPLHSFSHRRAENLQRSLAAILSVPGLRARYLDRYMTSVHLGGDRNPNDTLRGILSQLWVHIVKPVLDGLVFSVRDSCLIIFSSPDAIFLDRYRAQLTLLAFGGAPLGLLHSFRCTRPELTRARNQALRFLITLPHPIPLH
jgi:tetratricopeptide (TPR) repeat protein